MNRHILALTLLVLLNFLFKESGAICPFGWLDPKDSDIPFCYRFQLRPLDNEDLGSFHWVAARKVCTSSGGNLASFSTVKEANWIKAKSMEIGPERNWYVGLKFTNNKFIWTDGTPSNADSQHNVSFVNWEQDQPDLDWDLGGIALKDCARMTNTTFATEFCLTDHSFICKIRNDQLRNCETSTQGTWHDGPNGNCYRFYNKKEDSRSWYSASDICGNQDATLPIIKNGDENTWMTFNMGNVTDIWLGLVPNPEPTSDSTLSKRWMWVNGEELKDGQFQGWSLSANFSYDRNSTGTTRALALVPRGTWSVERKTENGHNFLCMRSNKTCPARWKRKRLNCYFTVSTERVTWSMANDLCRMRNSRLITIRDQIEQSFIQDLVKEMESVPLVWTGASQRSDRGEYFWPDGSQVTNNPDAFTSWLSPPEFSGEAGCVKINRDAPGGNWTTTKCADIGGYICQLNIGEVDTPIMTTPPYSPDCEPGWTLVPETRTCYAVSEDDVKYDQAAKVCADLEATVATVQKIEDQGYIGAKLNSARSSWIGLELINGTYKWIDGKNLDYTNWGTNQPRNESERCTVMFLNPNSAHHGRWASRMCDQANRVLCVKPPSRPTTTPPLTTLPPTSASCDWPWEDDHISPYCYQFRMDYAQTWSGAQLTCKSQGGDLASITNPAERNYIFSRLQGLAGVSGAWIGLTASPDRWVWKWSDKSPLSYFYWDTEFPKYSNPDDKCSVVSAGNGRMANTDCRKRFFFICKKLGKPLPNTATTVSTNVPSTVPPTTQRPGYIRGCNQSRYGYEYNSKTDHCYAFIPLSITWSEAARRCADDGGYLPSIHSDGENLFISNLIARTGAPSGTKAWIGIYDSNVNSAQQVFAWANGANIRYTNWGNKQPTNSQSGGQFKDCGAIVYGDDPTMFSWNDEFCEQPLPGFICKKHQTMMPPDSGSNLEGCPKSSDGTYAIQAVWDDFKCVYFEQYATLNHNDSNKECQRRFGGTLVAITTRTQQASLVTAMYKYGLTSHMWIGLLGKKYAGIAVWSIWWITRDPIPFHQVDMSASRPGETPCGGIAESKTVGMWNLRDCADKIGYVCERLRDGRTKPPWPTQSTLNPRSCRDGDLDIGNNCYRVFSSNDDDSNVRKTFPEAVDHCKNEGGIISSIESDGINNQVVSKMGPGRKFGAWIGLRKGSHGFEWIDGTPYFYSNWGVDGEPELDDQKGCVQIRPGVVYWGAAPCSDKKNYICKIPKGILAMSTTTSGPITTPDKEATKACWGDQGVYEPGWRIFNGICYYFSVRETNWFRARDMCRVNRSAELTSVRNDAENDFIMKTMVEYHGRDQGWIGLNELNGLNYKWINGDPNDYWKWVEGQSGDSAGSKLCVTMNSNVASNDQGRWRTHVCTRDFPYVCKKYINRPPTSPPPPSVGNCPKNWVQYRSKCYMVVNKTMNFSDGIQTCKDSLPSTKRAFMVSIQDIYDNSFVLSLFGASNLKAEFLWTGMYNRKEQGICDLQWQSNEPKYFFNWAPGHPNYCYQVAPGYYEMCVMMRSIDGKWQEGQCRFELYPICMTYLDPENPKPEQDKCTSGYTKFGDKCVRAVSTPRSWQDARQDCTGAGDLLSIHNVNDQNFARALFSEFSQAQRDLGFFIGLNTLKDIHTLEWSTGWQFSYSNWERSEPQMNDEKRRCVSMDGTTGRWTMRDCGEARGYLCVDTKSYGATPPPTLPSMDGGRCPQNSTVNIPWVPLSANCYAMNIETGITFTEAFQGCVSEYPGSMLTSIRSQVEQDFVQHELARQWDILSPNRTRPHPVRNAWLGFYYRAGKLEAIDGSPVSYANWAPNQPNAPNAAVTYCVKMQVLTGRWDIIGCRASHKFGFACRGPKMLGTTPRLTTRTTTRGWTWPTDDWIPPTRPPPRPTNTPHFEENKMPMVLKVLIPIIVILGLMIAIVIIFFLLARYKPDVLPEKVRAWVATMPAFSGSGLRSKAGAVTGEVGSTSSGQVPSFAMVTTPKQGEAASGTADLKGIDNSLYESGKQ